MTQIITSQLNHIYEGDPWYGRSIKAVLESVDPQFIFGSPGKDMHSIAEIVAHMLSYRDFTEQRLQGSTGPPPEQEQTFDWKAISPDEKHVWQIMIEQFNISQQNLLLLLDQIEDSFLEKNVPGKDYSFQYLLTGIVQHDLYHLGQIVYINKLAGGKREITRKANLLNHRCQIFPYEHLARIK